MQNYDKIQTGFMYHDDHIHAPTATSATAFTHNFSVSGMGHGDYKSPTLGSYRKVLKDHCRGEFIQGDLNGHSSRFYHLLDPWFGSTVYWGEDEYSPYHLGIARNKAIEAFYADAYSAGSQLASDAAEAHELHPVISGIARPVSALGAGMRGLARSLTGVRRGSRAAANAWLAYKYGLQVPIQSLYDAARTPWPSFSPRYVVGKGSSRSRTTDEYAYHMYEPGVNHVKLNSDLRCAKRFCCLMTVSSPADLLVEHFSPVNPLSLVWELSHLSFVVDWVVDFGSFLNSLEKSLGIGVDFGQCFETTFARRDNMYTSRGSYTNGVDVEAYWNYHAREAYTHVTRELCDVPVINPFYPKVGLSLGGTRLLTAASLLRKLI